jgi:hypothetical protein
MIITKDKQELEIEINLIPSVAILSIALVCYILDLYRMRLASLKQKQ